MTFHTERIVETERLLLRLFTEVDAPEVAQMCNNYNLYKNTLYLPYPYTKEDALTWIKNHLDHFIQDKHYEFAITDKGTGQLYGAIALSNNKRFNHGEIAFWVGEEYWGKGYATEAAKAMLDFAFIKKGYQKVFARYFSTNLASSKVLEKIGMKEEGVLKKHVRKDNEYLDLVHVGILKQGA